MSGIMAAFIGGSGGYPSLVLNVGAFTAPRSGYTTYGYSTSGYGSLTPTAFPPVPSNSVTALNYGNLNNLYTLSLSSPAINSGWTSIKINGLTLNRASGSFSTYGWTWTAPDSGAALTGSVGANVKISFA